MANITFFRIGENCDDPNCLMIWCEAGRAANVDN
jgi:hypothetical protein